MKKLMRNNILLWLLIIVFVLASVFIYLFSASSDGFYTDYEVLSVTVSPLPKDRYVEVNKNIEEHFQYAVTAEIKNNTSVDLDIGVAPFDLCDTETNHLAFFIYDTSDFRNAEPRIPAGQTAFVTYVVHFSKEASSFTATYNHEVLHDYRNHPDSVEVTYIPAE